MFRSFGAPEIILILVIILIFFGVGKLPQVGAALGKGIRAFRKGQMGEEEDEELEVNTAPEKVKTSRATRTRKTASKQS